jgi:protein involved in polysaccharide export with SLBB domain
VSDLVGWAGGFRPTANRAAVHLIRGWARYGPGQRRSTPSSTGWSRLSRNEMTESEYTKLETKLAEQKNTFTIDWSRLQPGSADRPAAADGDVVRVDRFVPTVRIEGQVKRPGYVDYAPGRTLSEYVDLAGGFTERSARSSRCACRAR